MPPFDSAEIGPLETKVRRKRISPASAPMDVVPSSANIADAAMPQRRRRTISDPTSKERASAVAPIDSGSNSGIGGEGHFSSDNQRVRALSAPIEPEATPVRKRRAIKVASPNVPASGVSPIGQTETSVRKQGGIIRPSPNPLAPPASNIEIGHSGDAVSGGEVQLLVGTQSSNDLSAIVSEIVDLQRQRVFCITQQSRADRSIESYISSAMGFRLDATEKDRKAVFARAKAFRLAVEKGGEGQSGTDTHAHHALAAITPMILTSAAGREAWDSERDKAEKEMEKLSKKLPVWEFAKGVRGLGALGLAAIVAEAGIPIGDYRSVSGLWKRMGLAVINGERQRKKSNPDEAKEHGYSPRRRAQIWSFCSDSMFRAQWRAEKDEDGKNPRETGKPVAIPAHPLGPYGEVYANRRQQTAWRVTATGNLPQKDPDKWTDGRCHNDGRRIMTKALLRDLWRVWRGLPPRGATPESPQHGD